MGYTKWEYKSLTITKRVRALIKPEKSFSFLVGTHLGQPFYSKQCLQFVLISYTMYIYVETQNRMGLSKLVYSI